MALLNTDQVYIQRDAITPEGFTKHKTTIGDIADQVKSNIDNDYDILNEKIDQEILDRVEGDEFLDSRVTALSNKIRTVSEEVFEIKTEGRLTYKRNNTHRNNYYVQLANCDPSDPLCPENTLDTFFKAIAADTLLPTDNGFFSISGADSDSYETTTHIFLSENIGTSDFDWSTAADNSLIKLSAVYVDSQGVESASDTNYVVFRVVNVDYPPETDALTGKLLYRIDVSYADSYGSPDLNNPEMFVQYMRDQTDSFGDAFVEVIGDTMTGALNIEVDHTSEYEPGLTVNRRAVVPEIKIVGYEGGPPTGSPGQFSHLHFSNTLEDINITFDTELETYIDFNGNFFIRFQENNLIVFTQDQAIGASQVGNFITFNCNVAVNGIARYPFLPNLLSGDYVSDPNVIPPRAYVDLKDAELQIGINDINNRLDTLANVVGVYTYMRIGQTEHDECVSVTGGNDSINQAGDAFNNCMSGKITSANANMFDFHPMVGTYDDIDESGNTITLQREEHAIVLGPKPTHQDTGDEIEITWQENIELGDYLEVASVDLRIGEAYIIYRITKYEEDSATGNLKAYGVPLTKTGSVYAGNTYRIKVYDKQGITLEDTDLRYVKLTGDRMFGPLEIESDPNNQTSDVLFTTDIEEDPDPNTNQRDTHLFQVTHTGVVKALSYFVKSDANTDAVEITHDKFETNVVGSGGFTFKTTNDSTKIIFRIGSSEKLEIGENISVKNKLITNVADAESDTDALTRNSFINDSNPILYSTNPFLKIEVDGNRFKFTSEPRKVEQLENYSDSKNNLKSDSILLYDSSTQNWSPSKDPYKQFKPGNQVASIGSTSTLEKGGFFLSGNQLYIKLE